ncbi:MAG: hypothetical protein HQK83_16345 [Fibrobacteria bacterium]|nr:hypothetical protein [Fibrobacteria bacterium]
MIKVYSATCLLFACLTLANAKTINKLSWKLEGSIGGGFESNIFKGPELFEEESLPTSTQSADTIDPRAGSGFVITRLQAAPRFRINPRNCLKARYTADFTPFFEDRNINEYDHDGYLEWEGKTIKKLFFSVRARLKYIQQRDSDKYIYGGLEKFIEPSFKPDLTFKINKQVSLKTEYMFRYKNYIIRQENDSTSVSDEGGHDFTEHRITLASPVMVTGQKSGPELVPEFSFWRRAYGDYPNLHADSIEYNGFPSRLYHYTTLQMKYKQSFPFIKPSFSLRMRWRNDVQGGYYNYYEYRLKGGCDISVGKLTLLEMDVSWRDRSYKERTAAVPGPNPELFWKNLDMGFGVSRRLIKKVNLKLEYDYRFRDTNTGYLRWKSDRDYKDHIITASIDFRIF